MNVKQVTIRYDGSVEIWIDDFAGSISILPSLQKFRQIFESLRQARIFFLLEASAKFLSLDLPKKSQIL